jgi:hypothetical protein
VLYLFDLVYSKEVVCFYLHKLGVIFPMLELEFEMIPNPINAKKRKKKKNIVYTGVLIICFCTLKNY